ncbi:MAG: hypothetical protein H6678_15035 [Candidatus Delongbacteria bacterium]|nr:hypothetical protein [Candidatus Cloacimonadota bacterium]MCB9475114.1 hypothetical protein [Candidatus Delongbacteria bacterium]
MSRDSSQQFIEFRSEVISINRAFAGIRPLIRETRHLSLNAETSCLKVGPAAAAFSVVVKDMNQLSDNLGMQINSLEQVFNRIVKLIGEWGKIEKRTSLFLQAQTFMASDVPTTSLRSTGKTRLQVDEQVLRGHADSNQCLENLSNEILRLNRLISELNQIAVRQCRFIAISSMIEAQRVECEADGDLTTVAHDINNMANRIGRIENDARERILNLMASVRTMGLQLN